MPNFRAAAAPSPGPIERAADPVVRCPGCGRRASLARDESAVASCACCTTQLLTYRRRFDVEGSVRERLYGSSPANVSRRAV